MSDADDTGTPVTVGSSTGEGGGVRRKLFEVVATSQVDVLARYDTRELAAIGAGLDGQTRRRIRACGDSRSSTTAVGVASLTAPPSITGLIVHAEEALSPLATTAASRSIRWGDPGLRLARPSGALRQGVRDERL